MSSGTETKFLAGPCKPSVSLPNISVLPLTRNNNSRDNNPLKRQSAINGPSIMPESLEVDTARRKSSIGEDWTSEHLITISSGAEFWSANSDSVTVGPVSPKILSLCSKFATLGDSSSHRDHLAPYNSRPRSKSVTLASVAVDRTCPERKFFPDFLQQESAIHHPKPLNLMLAPPGFCHNDVDGGGLLPKQLLSPSTSPSSGYGSGVNSSSPICLSPRSHSPTLDMHSLHREHSDEKTPDLLEPPDETRTLRTLSHDSGVSRLSVDSPSAMGRSSSEEEPCQESQRHSKVRSMHTHFSSNFTIQVPKPVRPQLVKTKPVFHLYPPESPIGKKQPEVLSPDEGFQDLKYPLEQSSTRTAFSLPTPTYQPGPLSPGHMEIKRSELTVRLNPPGSPLPPRIHQTSLGLDQSSPERHRRLPSQGTMDSIELELLERSPLLPHHLSAPSLEEEQSVPSSTEPKPFKRGTMPPALVISDLCETTPPPEPSQPGAFMSNSGPNSTLHYLTLSDIRSDVVLRKLSTDSSISSLSQGSIEDVLEDIHHSASAPDLSSPAKPQLSAAAKRARFSSASSWRKIRNMVHWSPFVQSFKKKYPWVQLAGHQGNFKAGEYGTILKKFCPKEEEALRALMCDVLRPYIPEYKGNVERNSERYVQMQDLLGEFDNPSVMDCKMGTRTYLEEELMKAREKPKLRKDMYVKMIEIDPSEPTEEENKLQAVTKPRYMQWREYVSSSATQGYRIEGIKKGDGHSSRDFKTTKTREQVIDSFNFFLDGDSEVQARYIRRLKAIRATLEASPFFTRHEVIGSSLLFVHDRTGKASIWMIDFGKTTPLPDGATNDHRTPWVEGNNEDGYLFGLDQMIQSWTDLVPTKPVS